MKYTKEQIAEATTYLHEYVKPGDTVYTILRQVSRSGMSRHISTLIRTKEGMHDITYLAAKVLEERRADDGGIVVSGCGMDMGFEVVYRLGHHLWPEGYTCAGSDKCHSADHVNGDRDYTPHLHKSGGYALRQEWL